MVVNFDKNYPRQSFVPTSSASVSLTLIMAPALGASSIDQDTSAPTTHVPALIGYIFITTHSWRESEIPHGIQSEVLLGSVTKRPYGGRSITVTSV